MKKQRLKHAMQYISMLLFFFTLSFTISIGQTSIWQGASPDWHDANNWNPVGVPTGSDRAIIPVTSNDPIISTAAEAESVVVNSDATLMILAGASLSINNAPFTGFTISGTCHNDGMINVGNTGAISSSGIFISGELINMTNGTINVDDTGLTGINSSGTITNFGLIDIGETAQINEDGVRSTGLFTNETTGTIEINQTKFAGFASFTSGEFINKGQLYIGNENSIGTIGMRNTMPITNMQGATITIDRTGTSGISCAGSFINEGEIKIGENGAIASSGIFVSNNGDFQNEASGVIHIQDISTSPGLSLSAGTNGIFTNKGKLNIGKFGAPTRDGISCAGTFTNEMTGAVNLNCTGSGINAFTAGSFVNEGQIEIGQEMVLPEKGINNQLIFTNETSGTIQINAENTLIDNSGLFTNRGIIETNSNGNTTNIGIINTNSIAEFNNEDGSISIKGVDQSALLNLAAVISNATCASISLEGALDNFSGTFQNNGILYLYTPENHFPGNFTNNGVVVDKEGTFPLGGSLTNNEHIIQAQVGACGPIDPAFDVGASSSFNILGIFTDEACTIAAGVYDAVGNTFSSNLANGDYVLYVKIEDAIGGCTEVVEWMVSIEEDMGPPTAACLDVTVTFNGEDEMLVAPAELFDAVNSIDDCGMLTQIAPVADVVVGCAAAGSTIDVTVTVDDGNGNTADCTATITVDGLPCGFSDMGSLDDCGTSNNADYDATLGSFTLSSDGCAAAFPYTDDQAAFIGFEFCGDGEIIAEVTNIIGTGFAGVMLRESYDPDVPMISMGTNQVNRVRKQVRVLAGYPAWPQAVLAYNQFWVRIVRNGTFFQGFASADGVNWFPYINQAINMSEECLVAGLYAYSEKESTPITATFSNVFVSGAVLPLTGTPPSAALAQASTTELSVYPNPVNQLLHISMTEFLGQSASLRLLNSAGQQLLYAQYESVESSMHQWEVSALKPGWYTLFVQTEETRLVEQIVITR